MFQQHRHYSAEIESAVLGACLLEKEAFGRTYGIVEKENFFYEVNQVVYDAMAAMYNNGLPVDLLTVNDYLTNQKKIIEFGSQNVPYFLSRLTTNVVSSANLEYHCVILRRMWMERELISLTHAGVKIEGEVKDQIQQVNKALQKINQGHFTKDWADMSELMYDLMKHQEEMLVTKGNGVTTGINILDRENGGFFKGQMIVIGARPSVGKCLAKGTKVRMFNGELKEVENIVIGDKVMGVDNRPRNVLSVVSGLDELYCITQRNGVSYTVNSEHIISIKRGKKEGKHKYGDVLNIRATDFFKLPPSTQKRFKGYMADGIEYPEIKLSIDPYFLGLWLGDGSSEGVGITTADNEIFEFICGYADELKLDVRKETKKTSNNNTSTYHISNSRCLNKKSKENIIYHKSAFHPYDRKRVKGRRIEINKRKSLKFCFQSLNLIGNKHIPNEYLINSRRNRLELLAGLIDSDGHVGKVNGAIEITMKNKELIYQIKDLCNSLGFRTSIKNKKATIKSINYCCNAYRIIISGTTFQIPLRIKRKRDAVKKVKHRNSLMTAIKISKAGIGEYYGFSLDGDHLFLLEDYTVTHNSAFMGQMAIAMAKKGTTVGIISLEMNNNEIAARLSAIETRDDFKKIYRNLYQDENERANWYHKITNMVSMPLFVSDSTEINPIQIKAKAQKLKHSNNLGCLMIDYLQLINGEGNAKNRTRENEVSQISRACKLMAKELEIPVIVLCQLNRAVTQRKGVSRYPQLSDLRESGSIEQDADVVMFIHRDWMMGEEYMTDENGNSTENQADLIVRKWRNGASNLHIKMEFDAPRMLFRQTQHLERWKPESTNYNDDNPF